VTWSRPDRTGRLELQRWDASPDRGGPAKPLPKVNMPGTMPCMDIRMEEILKLSVAERIQLVEDIWDSIEQDADAVPLPEAQRRELDRRLDAYEQDPSATQSWAEVREELDRDA
jgi:putative addiction module component (TIGR02574 family)